MGSERLRRLLLGTSNPSKVLRWRAVLDGYEVLEPRDLGLSIDIEEGATTVVENAMTKALKYSRVSGLVSLSEDAGLRVNALRGFPGAELRTWGGRYPRRLEDSELARLLAEALRGRQDTTSAFDIGIAVAAPDGLVRTTSSESCGFFDFSRLDAALEEGNPLSSAFISFDSGLPWTEMIEFDSRPQRSQEFIIRVRKMVDEVFEHWMA